MARLLFAAAVLLALTYSAAAAVQQRLAFRMEPKQQECLMQDIITNSKVDAKLMVTKGGLFDVKFLVKGPDGLTLFEKLMFSNVDDRTGQKVDTILKKGHNFVATQSGTYQFCFDNLMSRWTPKDIQFELFVAEPVIQDEADQPGKPAPLSSMEQSVKKIGDKLEQITSAQLYHRTREETHRNTAESNNSRVMWFSLLEALVLISASITQLLVVRRWFPGDRRRTGV